MKKRGLVWFAALFVVAAAALLGVSACGKNPGDAEKSVEIGGGSTVSTHGEYRLEVPERVNVSAGASNYDFAAKGKVTDADGKTYAPRFDASGVDLNVAGEYSVVYSYGEQSAAVPVFVYSQPRFLSEETALALTYEQALTAPLASVTAEDCFGRPLIAFALSDGGMTNSDGSCNSGTFSVAVGAMDAAGNLIQRDMSVTVREGDTFAVSGETRVDLMDGSVKLVIDEDVSFVGMSVSGTLLPAERVERKEGTLQISAAYLVQRFGLGEKHFRILARSGFYDGTLRLTDDVEPQLDLTGLNGWIYRKDEVSVLPQPVRKNPDQQFTLTAELTDAEGAAVPISDGRFTGKTAGRYTYALHARKSNGRTYTHTLSLTVYEKAVYDAIVDPASGTQFLRRRFSIPVNNEAGFRFDYYGQTVGGVTGCYRLTAGSSGNWYNRFELDKAYVAGVGIENYTTLRLDAYFTKATDISVWLNTADTSLAKGGVKMYDKTTGEEISYPADVLNEWVELRIDISGYDTGSNTQRIAVAPTAKDCTVYLRNFTFA